MVGMTVVLLIVLKYFIIIVTCKSKIIILYKHG